MTQATTIVRTSLRLVLPRRRILLFGVLALLPVGTFLGFSGGRSGIRLLENFLEIGIFQHFIIAIPVTTLILSAAVLGDERRDETLSFLVVRPIGRGTIAGAKLASAVLAALSFNAVGALAMATAYGLRADDWRYVLPMLVGSIIASVIYAAIFVPLGYFSERSTLIGLAYVFVWELAIVGNLGALATTSPWRLGYSAFVSLAPAEMLTVFDRESHDFILGNLTASAPTALLQAALFLAASTAVLTWILRKRDLV